MSLLKNNFFHVAANGGAGVNNLIGQAGEAREGPKVFAQFTLSSDPLLPKQLILTQNNSALGDQALGKAHVLWLIWGKKGLRECGLTWQSSWSSLAGV